MEQMDGPRKRRRLLSPDPNPYVLRSVLADIPLRGEETKDEDIHITAVEYWNENLYIGTSASELLHLVAIPGENAADPPTYILASRLQPGGHSSPTPANQAAGVQQILLLPGPAKACILCNGTVSFYTLPELTPATPNRPPTGVQWIGGIDEDDGRENPDGHVVMLATTRRIMLVRVGEKLKAVKNIDYPGCLRSSRRDTIACVANDVNYALLEVEHQQQIPLFPISTAPDPEPPARESATSSTGHSRSTSLGNPLISQESRSVQLAGQNLEVPDPDQRARSPSSVESGRSTGRPRSSTESIAARSSARPAENLKPHILSPTSTEFMLTTGTSRNEPGVGLFVNLDGDVVRGTIEFDRYPQAILVHSFENQHGSPTDDQQKQILALLDKTDAIQGGRGIEVQELSSTVDVTASKAWISLPPTQDTSLTGGLHECLTPHHHSFSEMTEILRSVRYKPPISAGLVESDPRTKASIDRLEQETALFENQTPPTSSPSPEYEERRNEEELRFVSQMGSSSTKAVTWCGKELWQILQNPLLLQLEHKLFQSGCVKNEQYNFDDINITQLMSLICNIHDRDPQNEVEFITFNYIRQKASLIMFIHVQKLIQQSSDVTSTCQIVRNALIEGSIDPRVVLLLIPPLARESLQGPNGIWLPQGIVDVLTAFEPTISSFQGGPTPFWLMIRQFLSDWQDKRGYGSISDEKYVFDSVDAALLHTLLYLDQSLPEGSAMQTTIRVKLNNVVDHWKGDFHRAIVLLEHYRRLFVLSRLYQSRKLAKDVLSTWKRIADGEQDADNSLTTEAVELQVRRYLTKIGNANLVQEYGLWLAQRNSDLAVQVFADDDSRVKLSPAEVVAMLKDKAPGAVQQYLEHLVFGKHLDQYADDLIGYYLDSVLNVLESSQAARKSLEDSYSAYRALETPKPTYLNFIIDNAPPQPWWQSRLRLLQLLGSGGYAHGPSEDGKELTYSVDKVLERLAPYSTSLVSESIILDARQGRHKEALRLLTHGLGDYDTAIRYCYFGGPAPSTSQPIDVGFLPSKEVQKDLFGFLFHEFLRIEDVENRLERTSHLLGTFATWFDPLTVFDDIPQDWTVGMLSEFLVRSFRAATTERNQVMIMKALSAAQNLQNQAIFIEMCEKLGPKMETNNDDVQSQPVDAAVT